jgi:hypothetical protein
VIETLDGKPIKTYSFGMLPSSVKVCSILLPCRTGYKLSSVPVAGLLIEGRRGVAGGWTNLETSSIDTTADDGLTIEHQIQITSDATIGRRKVRILFGP